MGQKRSVIDYETQKHIKKIRKIQFWVILTIILLFVIFTKIIISGNVVTVKKTALAEVQESMQENINNVTIQIDHIRTRTKDEGIIAVLDLAKRMEKDGIASLDDVLSELDFCKENILGQFIEAIYTAQDGTIYYINAFERTSTLLTTEQVPLIHQDAAVCNILMKVFISIAKMI